VEATVSNGIVNELLGDLQLVIRSKKGFSYLLTELLPSFVRIWRAVALGQSTSDGCCAVRK
jgi:hypothetical protein